MEVGGGEEEKEKVKRQRKWKVTRSKDKKDQMQERTWNI